MRIFTVRLLVFTWFTVFLSNCESHESELNKGAVSSAHPLATHAGLRILHKGGNAFDAAIAIASVLNVVEPMMSGIGGYGTILIYDAAQNEVRYLNSSGKFPALTNTDSMRAPVPLFMENRFSAKAVSTPGNVNAWYELHQRYGLLEWRELFSDAIAISRSGFVIDRRLADAIQVEFEKFNEYAKYIYGKKCKPLHAGDTLVQTDLMNSFKLISEEGPGVFYNGAIAQAIDKQMKEQNGYLRISDLNQDTAEWWEPARFEYRGFGVFTAGPPSNAFAALTTLGMMELLYPDTVPKQQSTTLYHHFSEVTKRSFYYRLKYSGDPISTQPDLDFLLSRDFLLDELKHINSEMASEFNYPQMEGENTTHFVAVDRWGNIVSATQTLGDWFGSDIMVEGTGIWLNNSMAYCTFEPKGNPMDAQPGKYKLSGDCPVIITKDGLPWAALGTPGGHTITQNVPQIIMNLIDHNMSMQRAIDQPKIAFEEPNFLRVDPDLPDSLQSGLEKRGHLLIRKSIGNAHGIRLIRDGRGQIINFDGGADRRGVGVFQIQ